MPATAVIAASGPARAAHGFFRVDTLSLDDFLTNDTNIISVTVCGYAVNNFEYPEWESFLCAEFVSGGECISATGVYNFEASEYKEKLKYTQRYSFQRTFAEVYRCNSEYDILKTDADKKAETVELVTVSNVTFLDRNVPYPTFEKTPALGIVSA